MSLSNKKVVVIGGAGLIGSHTVDKLLLEDLKEIIIYDNFVRGTHENLKQALKDPRVKIYEAGGDITQTDILHQALKGADAVLHFAALWLLQCQEFPSSAFEVNIRGTFNVLEACVAQKVQKLVYSSSASVYGDAVEEPMTETHPFNNTNFYGATKIAGEAMATAYYNRYKLPFTGLRYMNVYGPRQDYKGAYIAVIMKMLDALDKQEKMKLYGDGGQSYDFVYVEDCAKANVCALKAEALGQFYNVGTGIRTSILQLAHLLQEISGTTDNLEFLAEGQTFVKNRVGCPKKASKDLGFKAEVDVKTGLKKLIDWRALDKKSKGSL